MKVFITGGAGFIGSHLTSRFLLAGWDVVIYDAYLHYAEVDETFVENLSLRKDLVEGAHIIKGSTLDTNLLAGNIKNTQPDVVIHLASLPIANRAMRNSEAAFKHILQGTYNMLEVMKWLSTRFVYISSSMAYADFQSIPVPEYAEMRPVEPYGAMKLCGEVLTKTFSKAYGFPYTIIRPSAVYGPGDCNKRVVQIFLEKAIRGETATIFSGNDTVMDFTFVEDTVEGIFRAATLREGEYQIFNITRGEGRSLIELAEIIKVLVPDFRWESKTVDDARPKRGALDVSRARGMLTYTPQWPLERGVGQYFDYMQQYNTLGR